MSTAAPKLEFRRGVPYDDYVHATTLHSLQQPVSKDPGEMSFLMISQVMELYFGLVRFELREAQRALREEGAWAALAPLRRTTGHLEGLNAAWRGLHWMTPADFNRFRHLLGDASGFQSPMYRHLELLLGLRSAALLRVFRAQPEWYEELQTALRSPSVWDEANALLARAGHPIPAGVLGRDFAADYEPHPAVEAAWVAVYADERPDNPLRLLGEAFTDVAEEFGQWRFRHLTTVQRTIGAKTGSGGSSGVAWLQHSLSRVVFPELWSARTSM